MSILFLEAKLSGGEFAAADGTLVATKSTGNCWPQSWHWIWLVDAALDEFATMMIASHWQTLDGASDDSGTTAANVMIGNFAIVIRRVGLFCRYFGTIGCSIRRRNWPSLPHWIERPVGINNKTAPPPHHYHQRSCCSSPCLVHRAEMIHNV